MVTKGAVAKAAPKSADDALLWVLGGIVVMSLLKKGIGKLNPIPEIIDSGKVVIDKTIETAPEVGESAALAAIPGGSTFKLIDRGIGYTALPKEEGESWIDYALTLDYPGVPKYNLGDIPKNVRDFQLEGWARNIPLINVREEDESWMDYVSTVDFPGVPKYDLRDVPGDIGGFIGGIFN
jgi:hypothetical protein|tara:strand:+ start:110 stop:649 length:540 start_codon:yes stop_codon:yes gene_type:complete